MTCYETVKYEMTMMRLSAHMEARVRRKLLLFVRVASATTTTRNESESDLGSSACERVVDTLQKGEADAARHLPTKPGTRLTASKFQRKLGLG